MEDSTTLVLLGLAVSIVFRARQFSLGAEGQLLLGALATAVVALKAPVPAPFHLILALVAAGTVGFLWGLIPGLLKAYLKVDEIVSTLMLNVIALQLSDLLLFNWLRDPHGGFHRHGPLPGERGAAAGDPRHARHGHDLHHAGGGRLHLVSHGAHALWL